MQRKNNGDQKKCDMFRDQRGPQELQRMLYLGAWRGRTQTKTDFACSSEEPGPNPLDEGSPQEEQRSQWQHGAGWF